MANELIIPNAKQVAKKSATLWTGYVATAIIAADFILKWAQSDISAGLSDTARAYVLMATTVVGMVLRFWQQNLAPRETYDSGTPLPRD